jgi:hypothetical protein
MTRQINLNDEQVAFLTATLEMTIMNGASISGPFSAFEPIFNLLEQVDPERAKFVGERLQFIRKVIVDSIESVIDRDNEEVLALLSKIQEKVGKITMKERLVKADERAQGKFQVLKGGKN